MVDRMGLDKWDAVRYCQWDAVRFDCQEVEFVGFVLLNRVLSSASFTLESGQRWVGLRVKFHENRVAFDAC